MKILSEINRSTRAVWLCCLCFLLVTVGVLLYLMKSPIDPFDPNAVVVIRNEQEEQLIPLETGAEPGATTAPDELSEWSASVDGYTRFTGEYIPFTRAPQDETTDSTASGMTETSTAPVTETTDTTAATETTATESASEYEHSDTQTVTETIATPGVIETQAPTVPPVEETVPDGEA